MTEAPLSALARSSTLDELESRRFDVLIVGGGITGAGIARDAAMRGLSVALIEAEDFAAGTSSRSSKLIHGGLRYLAMGDVALVTETALERKAVHALAPHLAEPCWMLVPARSRTTLLKFMAGITAYEKLGAVEKRDVHVNWNAGELARGEPLLDRQAFPWACVYREYLTDDARLVLATLRGARRSGALVASRVRAHDLLVEQGRVDGVRARCAMEGRELEVRADLVPEMDVAWLRSHFAGELLFTLRIPPPVGDTLPPTWSSMPPVPGRSSSRIWNPSRPRPICICPRASTSCCLAPDSM